MVELFQQWPTGGYFQSKNYKMDFWLSLGLSFEIWFECETYGCVREEAFEGSATRSTRDSNLNVVTLLTQRNIM